MSAQPAISTQGGLARFSASVLPDPPLPKTELLSSFGGSSRPRVSSPLVPLLSSESVRRHIVSLKRQLRLSWLGDCNEDGKVPRERGPRPGLRRELVGNRPCLRCPGIRWHIPRVARPAQAGAQTFTLQSPRTKSFSRLAYGLTLMRSPKVLTASPLPPLSWLPCDPCCLPRASLIHPPPEAQRSTCPLPVPGQLGRCLAFLPRKPSITKPGSRPQRRHFRLRSYCPPRSHQRLSPSWLDTIRSLHGPLCRVSVTTPLLSNRASA